MSTQINDPERDSTVDPSAGLDALGDECARTILVATTERPRTAKELTSRTDSSSATVYRRINSLLESGLLEESIRFEEDGSHTTAYEGTVTDLHVSIDTAGIDVEVTDRPGNR